MPIGAITFDSDSVKTKRASLGLSQKQTAALTGLHKRTIENAESGKAITRSAAASIANALNTSVESLMGSSDSTSRHSYYEFQQGSRPELKLEVANVVASLVPRGAILACSSGTTVAMSLAKLVRADSSCQIITNNIGAIEMAGQGDATIMIAGGTYVYRIHACVGNEAVESFRRVRFDTAIIGVSGIDGEGRCYVRHNEDIDIYDHIIRSAKTIIIAADITKLGTTQVHECPPLEWIRKKNAHHQLLIATNPLDRIVDDPTLKRAASRTIESLRQLPTVKVFLGPTIPATNGGKHASS